MVVKLLMSWDIRDGQEQEYFEFVVREFVPGIQKLGIRPTEAWYTQYGEGPQILAGAVSDDLSSMRSALATDEWTTLLDRLLLYVTNYDQKVIRATGGFQL